MTRFTTLALALVVALAGCDSENSTGPEEAAQKAKQAEGTAWRDLLSNLDRAEDVSQRIELLDRFITDYPEHPDIKQAKKRLEEARAQMANVEAFQKLRSEAFDEKDATAVISLFAADIARQATNRAMTGELEETTLPTPDGSRTFDSRLLFAPTHLRGRTRIALKEHAPDLVEERCDQECVNNAVNNLLKATTGEPLFARPGAMNPTAVKALLKKVPVSADTSVLGLSGAQMYALYRPTIRAFARTRDAAKEAGLEDAADAIKDADPREVRAFYRTFTTENGIADAVELDEKTARAFTSWWIRRWADGTGPLLDAKLDEVLETFDPEFTGAEPVEDAGEEK